MLIQKTPSPQLQPNWKKPPLPPKPVRLEQDEILQNPRFQKEVKRSTLWGVALGAVAATGLTLATKNPPLGVVVAMGLSGALVGGCVAEEQVKLKWGVPVEMPPAYR